MANERIVETYKAIQRSIHHAATEKGQMNVTKRVPKSGRDVLLHKLRLEGFVCVRLKNSAELERLGMAEYSFRWALPVLALSPCPAGEMHRLALRSRREQGEALQSAQKHLVDALAEVQWPGEKQNP